jgi:hypothetical protein
MTPMTVYSKLLDQALDEGVTPELLALGFGRARRRLSWTSDELQIRPVLDSKATDPYSGGAFTLEFEIAHDRRFEWKLAGRVRIDQLLDSGQRGSFLHVRNAVAERLPRPPEQHLSLVDPSLRGEYLKPFERVEEMETGWRFWMPFRTTADVVEWCDVIVPELRTLIARARTLPPHELLLGKSFCW